MKRYWKMGLVFVALMALMGAAVGFVSAQTDDGDAATPPTEGPEVQKSGIFEDYQARLAKNLGLTEEEFQAVKQETALDMVNEALAAGDITQEQADALIERIESGEFRPGGPRPGGPGHHCRGGEAVRIVAEYLELEAQDILADLREGSSLTQVIEANGGSVEEVVQILLSQLEERLAQAVESGKITQERADEALANAETKIVEGMNHEGPPACFSPRGGPRGGDVAPPFDGSALPGIGEVEPPVGSSIQF